MCHFYEKTIHRIRRQLKFLMRWPSSTIISFHVSCIRNSRSFIAISYEVTTTGNEVKIPPSSILCRCRISRLSSTRSGLAPWYSIYGTWQTNNMSSMHGARIATHKNWSLMGPMAICSVFPTAQRPVQQKVSLEFNTIQYNIKLVTRHMVMVMVNVDLYSASSQSL